MTPEYINRRWSEELLALMFRMRNRRVRRMNPQPGDEPAPRVRRVSEDELFQTMGFCPETVN